MKKILILIFALTLCFALAACGGDDAPCTEHVDADANGKCDNCEATVDLGGGGDGGTTGEDLVLVTDSKTNFAVVAADYLSDKSESYVNSFIKDLNKYYLDDQNLKLNYDAPGFDDVTEIIFGPAKNRGEAFKKDEHYLGYKGFSIELIGNKLFVLAGGDDGYKNAIKYLEDTLFNLEGYGEDVIDELVIPAGTKYESIPTEYEIEEFTIDGKDVREFVLTYTASSKISKSVATILQETIYKEAGAWVPYVAIDKVTDDQKVIYVEFTKGDKERTTDNGFTLYVKGGDLHIECEFENKFEEMMNSFIDTKVSSSKVKISSNYTFSKDVRNIYYKDFGAVGDGKTDDFFALKECHEYANEWGHTVNGTEGHTYYIGTANGTQSIPVKTDTYWNLCRFIWDDRDIPDPGQGREYLANIFHILPDKSSYSITGNNLPVTSLFPGANTIGDWKPGEKVIVYLFDNTKRHYIRYGLNQNNGTDQKEIIIVRADGTIDPDTPIQWDYTTLSKMEVYPCDDTPITFSGGKKDQVDNYSAMGKYDNFDVIDRAVVETYFNDAPSAYNYFGRNIQITRSNVTIKNIQHVLHDDVEQSAPYQGFITILNASDIIVEGMIFQKQKPFSTTGAAGSDVSMGSYEIHANSSNKVTWRHCRQSNFFEPDGSVKSRGYMGTNYCKNLKFEDMLSCSFDAHCNLYNGSIIDSICEHINFIGGGTIYYENVTVYTDGNHAGIILRQDYGSTWDGNVIINGLTLKTAKENDNSISLIKAEYTNHYFGYTCHLPKKIELNDVKIVQYGYKMENGVRTEWDISTNKTALHLYGQLESYQSDISDPYANISGMINDYKACDCENVYKKAYPNDESKHKTFYDGKFIDGRCENDLDPTDSYTVYCWGFRECKCASFNDTDRDGFCNNDVGGSPCWGFNETVPKNVNANPYIPTEEIYINNCGDLVLIIPDTPQFDDIEVYIDGELQE